MAISFKLLQIFFCIFILNTAIEAAPAITENTMAKVDLSNEGNLMNENLDGNQPLQEVPGDFKEEITESPERINERKIRSPEFDTIDRAGFDDLGYHYFKKIRTAVAEFDEIDRGAFDDFGLSSMPRRSSTATKSIKDVTPKKYKKKKN
ncbi:hypothetical protein HCN44_007624 [Aphidius gifuensis]|uniref:Gustatory receptor n=1 Tax=Aphidius gifuensis TaxID=684658 RepID=A0A835CPI7_APHGI|nr:hypothetical protein HCN44_007624 [Aphidius gifuensis]